MALELDLVAEFDVAVFACPVFLARGKMRLQVLVFNINYGAQVSSILCILFNFFRPIAAMMHLIGFLKFPSNHFVPELDQDQIRIVVALWAAAW